MFRESKEHTNEELNGLKKRYNDHEAWWNRAIVLLVVR